jgi:amidohydrolase
MPPAAAHHPRPREAEQVTVIDDAEAMAGELAELRHAFHAEPEVGLHLPRTQSRILDALSDLPLAVSAGDELSSVTAVLRGARPGPTVLLRGDMDALPVTEDVDVAFRSRIEGTMHACGHDLHTSMLLGAARLLAARQDQLGGDVVFMFQPGEEGFDGASYMIKEGILDASGVRAAAAYGMHVFSNGWSHGTFATRPGPLMAASDVFSATVRGRGGHGSAPHNAKDPIPAACEMVLALQTFLTRNVSAFDPAVITVGQIHAGNRSNVIPSSATIEGTVRTFSAAVQARIAEGIVQVCEGIAAAHSLEVDTAYSRQYPVTVNTDAEAAFVATTVADVFGEEHYAAMAHPIAGAEDFSRVIAAVPGAMVFLGAAPPGSDGVGLADNHSAQASFDDGVLPRGAALYAELAIRRMAVRRPLAAR